ncbi:hypothetical protein BATDEDRAFT_24344 [Batrachochytrium dendrobatidis JAM81]|uniref:Uncharacterized protein n=1 Tax=Batrachochytrium dendrobatidis (strain JAM81 / FGSC 10211) TaxID=684364 RepID=F4P1S8_BATDJ|nr:uncharacterized protein BATDEDRAFT_24344 [Batrachochytrium dendrobatidis JAM81]EGF80597.1 hypothetical protein BATDEDRAFT_24344 [Batrachochytrium dendrobatidis JAM81]|eukprot:XP_006678418.1 hypothetical protein BATDEDRAFT_24344 [Batrachochytrium dendrobatidis JAM81]
MENERFYIKYLDYQPVEIETHFNGELERRRPLTDVADLVAAIVVEPTRRLAGIPEDYGPLTLHSAVDEPAIPGNTLLTSIQQPTGSYDHPLIIRSLSDTITMDEHMVCSLPEPVYDNPVSRPNTSGRIWKKPTHVFLWSDFKQSVVDWIGANHHQHSQRVQKPVFVPRVITEEVQSLQPFIKLNLLNISAKCFIPPSEFKARRQITSCVGEPDHLMTRNGEIVAIVEEKGNWALSISDIVNSYDTERTRASALDQLYHYMRLNHRQYGILSSYENTWFVYRNQGCAVCEEPQVHETLYVSEGISFLVH